MLRTPSVSVTDSRLWFRRICRCRKHGTKARFNIFSLWEIYKISCRTFTTKRIDSTFEDAAKRSRRSLLTRKAFREVFGDLERTIESSGGAFAELSKLSVGTHDTRHVFHWLHLIKQSFRPHNLKKCSQISCGRLRQWLRLCVFPPSLDVYFAQREMLSMETSAKLSGFNMKRTVNSSRRHRLHVRVSPPDTDIESKPAARFSRSQFFSSLRELRPLSCVSWLEVAWKCYKFYVSIELLFSLWVNVPLPSSRSALSSWSVSELKFRARKISFFLSSEESGKSWSIGLQTTKLHRQHISAVIIIVLIKGLLRA